MSVDGQSGRARCPHDRAGNLDLYDKILVEQTVHAQPRLHAVALRLGMVYGPRSYRHYRYLKPMIDQRPAIVLDEELAAWRQTPAYVENVAADHTRCDKPGGNRPHLQRSGR